MTQAAIEFLIKGRNEAQGTIGELNRDVKAVKTETESASTSFKQFGSSSTKSVGELTVSIERARKEITALKALAAANESRPGFVAGISAELDQAIPRLRQMESDLKKITGKPFDGATEGTLKWSDALGTAKGLLGAVGVSLSVGALVSFGQAVFDDVGKLNNLHQATGATNKELQQLQYVGAGAGLSVEDFGQSIGNLSKRLAGGDQSATDAVKALGLSVQDLIKAGPTEAFLRIGEAADRLQDPMQKNTLLADLFGEKLAMKLIPTLGQLRQEMANVPDSAIISDAQIQAIDEMGAAWDRLTLKAKAYFAEYAVGFTSQKGKGMSLDTVLTMYGPETASEVAGQRLKTKDISLPMSDAAAGVDVYKNTLKGLREESQALTAEQKAQIRTLLQYTDSLSTITAATKGGQAAVQRYIQQVKEGTREADQAAKAHDREAKALNAANSSMHDLSGAQVEAIRYYQQQHKSASDIAKILEVYPQQVSEVIAADKDAADQKKLLQKASEGVWSAIAAAQKKANTAQALALKAEGANYKAAQDAAERYADAVAFSDNERAQRHIQQINDWAERELAALDKTKAGYAEAAANIKATQQQLTQDILDDLELRSQALATQFTGPTLEQAGKVHKEFHSLKASILDLGDAFAYLAGDSDSAFDRIARGVGTVIDAMQQGQRAAEGFRGGWDQFSAGGAKNMLAGGAQMAAGAFDAYRSMKQATSGESRWGNVAGGAATGAQIGSNFGPWGTLIGGGIGALWGAFSNPEKKVNKTRQEFIDAAGGLDELNKKAFAATGSLDAVRKLLAAKNTKQFEEAVKGLSSALDEFDALAAEASSKFGPSKSDLAEDVADAKKLYDFMDEQAKKGEYTQEQVHAAYVAWQEAMAAAGDEAAKAWLKAHEAAAGGATETSAAFKALQDQWNGLAKSVENEAPEPDMGVVERQAREQMDRIKAEMDAMTAAQADTAEQTAQTTAESWTEAAGGTAESWKAAGEDWAQFMVERNAAAADKIGEDLGESGRIGAHEIRKAFDGLEFTIPVRYAYDAPTGPSGGPQGEAAGGIYASGARGVATWFGEGGQPEVGGPASFFERIFTKLGVTGDKARSVQSQVPNLNLTINVTGVVSEGDMERTVRDRVAPILYAAWRDNIEGHNSLASDALQGR